MAKEKIKSVTGPVDTRFFSSQGAWCRNGPTGLLNLIGQKVWIVTLTLITPYDANGLRETQNAESAAA